MLQTASAMHALLLPPQQRLRRGGGWGRGGQQQKKEKRRRREKKKEDGEMRVATSPARLQVNQLPVLGDKRMKYAASNWTLVNQGGVWGGGIQL